MTTVGVRTGQERGLSQDDFGGRLPVLRRILAVIEEQKRNHAEEATDGDADGSTLKEKKHLRLPNLCKRKLGVKQIK